MTEESLENLGRIAWTFEQFHVWEDSGRRPAMAAGDGRPEASRHGPCRRHQHQSLGAEQCGADPGRTGLIDAVQVIYNIFDQSPEERPPSALRGPRRGRNRPRALGRESP